MKIRPIHVRWLPSSLRSTALGRPDRLRAPNSPAGLLLTQAKFGSGGAVSSFSHYSALGIWPFPSFMARTDRAGMAEVIPSVRSCDAG